MNDGIASRIMEGNSCNHLTTTAPPTLHRLNHTLGPAHNRPLPSLLHELHSRLYLGAGRELPFS